MPNLIKQIPETMKKMNIPAETIARFDIPASSNAEDVMELIRQMDELLTKEQRVAIMEQQGCCKTGIGPKAHGEFGAKHADKPLEEKVALLNTAQMPHRAPCRLNADNTLTVYWGENDSENNMCPCGIIKKLPEPKTVSPTFCGCCGGHIRHNYQKSLGVKLRLKEIVSSASSSGGKKRCEFLYEII